MALMKPMLMVGEVAYIFTDMHEQMVHILDSNGTTVYVGEIGELMYNDKNEDYKAIRMKYVDSSEYNKQGCVFMHLLPDPSDNPPPEDSSKMVMCVDDLVRFIADEERLIITEKDGTRLYDGKAKYLRIGNSKLRLRVISWFRTLFSDKMAYLEVYLEERV